MKQPTILLATTDTWFRRDICSSLARFDYEVLVAGDDIEALAILKENRQVAVIVADIGLGGLALAREARQNRPCLGVIYTSVSPHQIAKDEKVPGAPTLRIPYGANQLAGVIRGLGRRVLDNTLAAWTSYGPQATATILPTSDLGAAADLFRTAPDQGEHPVWARINPTSAAPASGVQPAQSVQARRILPDLRTIEVAAAEVAAPVR